LDLFERGWVLLADQAGWREAASRTSERLGIGLKALVAGADFRPAEPGVFLQAFGVRQGGASLIRPDGVIAWRTVDLPEDPTGMLTEALGQASSAVRWKS
jgi:hypothetical protein